MRIFVVFLVSAFACSPVIARAQSTPQPAATLHQIYLEDQNDMPTRTPRTDPSAEALKAFDDRAATRRASLHAMLARGEITSGNDLYEAAFVFQHGETAPDYLLAHVLALDAVAKGMDRAKWLSVQPSTAIFSSSANPNLWHAVPVRPETAPPYHQRRSVQRANTGTVYRHFPARLPPCDFCVPDLEQQKKNLQTLNSGGYPRNAMTLPGCGR